MNLSWVSSSHRVFRMYFPLHLIQCRCHVSHQAHQKERDLQNPVGNKVEPTSQIPIPCCRFKIDKKRQPPYRCFDRNYLTSQPFISNSSSTKFSGISTDLQGQLSKIGSVCQHRQPARPDDNAHIWTSLDSVTLWMLTSLSAFFIDPRPVSFSNHIPPTTVNCAPRSIALGSKFDIVIYDDDAPPSDWNHPKVTSVGRCVLSKQTRKKVTNTVQRLTRKLSLFAITNTNSSDNCIWITKIEFFFFLRSSCSSTS